MMTTYDKTSINNDPTNAKYSFKLAKQWARNGYNKDTDSNWSSVFQP